MTPAELPPIASTRGSFDAASLSASRIFPWWYAGSFCSTGSQTISSLKIASPSTTADTFKSDAPRSKPMRHPSRCRPRGVPPSRAAGTSSAAQETTVKGRPWTCSPMKWWSKALGPSAA